MTRRLNHSMNKTFSHPERGIPRPDRTLSEFDWDDAVPMLEDMPSPVSNDVDTIDILDSMSHLKSVSSSVIYSGMLLKRGQGGFFHRSTWKTRYCVLTKKSFKYFKEKDLRGELDLSQAISIHVLSEDAKFSRRPGATTWRFEIEISGRRMLFSAITEKDMNMWIKSLYHAIYNQGPTRSNFLQLSLATQEWTVTKEDRTEKRSNVRKEITEADF